jgi:hypothetical protein
MLQVTMINLNIILIKQLQNAFASRFFAVIGEWDKVITVSNDLGNKPVSQLRDYQSYLDVDFNTGQRILREKVKLLTY